MSDFFVSREPQLEEYWRGIILFGRNVASYKFALAKSLLELGPASGTLVKMSEIAPVFSRHIAEHLKIAEKQGTFSSSNFLDAVRKFNSQDISMEELVEHTVRFGFNNVIDAFHVVGQGTIAKRFYLDERKTNDGIRITEEFSALLARPQSCNLMSEVESRWNLVERAWELGVSRALISVSYDAEAESLFTLDGGKRRKSVTGVRGALNGYQKGKCFYCFSDIRIDGAGGLPDVDHFFPHAFGRVHSDRNVNGIWNLVLACQACNRGAGGKFDKIPSIRLLERLHRRNEFLIYSHHPLRETLIQQTGNTSETRKKHLNDVHNIARASLLHMWECDEKEQGSF